MSWKRLMPEETFVTCEDCKERVTLVQWELGVHDCLSRDIDKDTIESLRARLAEERDAFVKLREHRDAMICSLQAQLAEREQQVASMASLLSGQQLESLGWKCPRCPSPHPDYDCAYPDCLQPPRTGE